MNLNWNLEKLYPSFDSKELLEDKKKLEHLLDSTIQWANKTLKVIDTSTLENYIQKSIEIVKLMEKLFAFGQLSFSVNVKNEKALELIEFCEKLLIKEKEIDVLFKEAIKNCANLDKLIENSVLLKEHEFFLLEEKQWANRLLSKEEELVMEKMKNTGSRAWEKLQDTLTSTLEVEYKNPNGNIEYLPLSTVRNFAYDSNRDVRKNAYKAELKAYKHIEVSVASALNSIKAQAILENELRGFDSVLDSTLAKSRMNKETLDAMLEAMKEALPHFAKFLKRKAKIISNKDSLDFYDLFAPIGQAKLEFTELEAKDLILENFYVFSKRLGDMATKAFNDNWVDFKPKEGKLGGAFCYNLHSIKESRILGNFTGNFSDVITLAHELGHAYHGEILNNESILNSDYSMPIAETASIFCESIVKKSILDKINDNDRISILEQDISDSLQVIVDIYSRFLFENKLIIERKHSSLSVEKIKEFMLNSQKEAYLDGLNHDSLHEYMWLCKGHYYSAELNYYNFPYAFGLLFSKGLYSIYLENKDFFVGKYDELLALTGKNTLEDIGKFIGIDLSKKEFWEKSINLIIADIDKFMELSKVLL